MKLSFKGFKKNIQVKAAALLVTAIMVAPAALMAQSDDEPEVETSTNSGPWQNSAGSTIGSSGNAITEGTARPADPNLNSAAGSAARPAAGPTPDATGGPGGNPDVPFDTNMNLVFLVAGISFAYIIYRRRLKLQAVPAKGK